MILGLDWLASFSPMQVHWAKKWISIPYEGATAILIGDYADLLVGSAIQLCLVQHDESSQSSSALHPIVSALLDEYAHLFEPVLGLPPSRHCDHSIPLIYRAPPVFVRPYRYAPVMKIEIERQVKDMLQQGII